MVAAWEPADLFKIGSFFVTPSFWLEPNDQMARAKRLIGLSQTAKWLYRKIGFFALGYILGIVCVIVCTGCT